MPLPLAGRQRSIPIAVLILAALVLLLAAGDWFSPEPAEAALIEVNSLEDSDDLACNAPGPGLDCTFREAIDRANQIPGADNISFNLGGAAVPNPVIEITDELPQITGAVTISGNTNGHTRVVIRSNPGNIATGIDINATNVTIEYMVIQSFNHGIDVRHHSTATIRGNRIGTSADGMTAVGNSVGIAANGQTNLIGGLIGTTPGGGCTGNCNLISGNTIGIDIAGEATQITGNFIGTNAAGTAAIANGQGVKSSSPDSEMIIGTGSPLARNVISGNYGVGLGGRGEASIFSNFIGTDTTGMQPLGNGGIGIDFRIEPAVIRGNVVSANLIGIRLDGNETNIEANMIGTGMDGTTPMGNSSEGIFLFGVAIMHDAMVGDENIIAFNGSDGVYLDGYQYALRNTITENSIHDNRGEGIHLENTVNGSILPPVITQATAGSVSGTTCNTCRVEVFSDGEDEGETYEGSTVANGSGEWTLNASIGGPNVTATTTDPDRGTSEFSAAFPLALPTPTPSTPTATASATAPPTPTSTVTPPVTPTSTGTSLVTPTAASITPTPAENAIAWGDHNCSGTVDTQDALIALLHLADIETDTGACPEMGDAVDVQDASTHLWGDVDCSDEIEALDALELFAFAAGFSGTQTGSCPDIGDDS